MEYKIIRAQWFYQRIEFNVIRRRLKDAIVRDLDAGKSIANAIQINKVAVSIVLVMGVSILLVRKLPALLEMSITASQL